MAGSMEPVGTLNEEKEVMIRSNHTMMAPQVMRTRFNDQLAMRWNME